MCGIAGFIDLGGSTPSEELKTLAMRMSDTLVHRGPDSGGVWVDAVSGVALGHRRLAILDLSSAGNQPMVSGSGRFVAVYNGELYNFRELRQEFESCGDDAVKFRGQADTEVMLACFDRWGVESSLPRFNGMFALAVWDRQERIFHLGRDRMGEKPLYYGWVGKTFLFGSELKALRVHPKFRAEIDRDALMLYMRHNCVPAPHSIYRGIYKLPPGNLLSLPRDYSAKVNPVPFWSLRRVIVDGTANPFVGSEREAVNQLNAILSDSVRMRMLSDVPLGGFLSGGVDSSLVTALMQAHSSRPVRTFTIGMLDGDYDEAQSAAAVAKHLGTEHSELYITAAEAMSIIPLLPTIYDEPFADSSQIPTLLVSQMARQHVTVGLSGDGGDELFGGYNRHVWSARIWDTLGWMPLAARSLVAEAIRNLNPQTWDQIVRVCQWFLPGISNHRNPGFKLHKIADMLPVRDRGELYLRHTSHWSDPGDVVLGGQESEYLSRVSSLQEQIPDFIQQMMYLDTVTYLPDDILAKLDRASMAVGLEARVPFLDHRVVEFSWSLPASMKIRNSQGKWLLRQLLYRYVPQALVDRPKMGFGIPIGDWLRGPLREWAEALLNPLRLRNEAFFDPIPIGNMWAEHLAGKGLWQYHLWDVLMFQAWLEVNPRCCDTLTESIPSFPTAATEAGSWRTSLSSREIPASTSRYV